MLVSPKYLFYYCIIVFLGVENINYDLCPNDEEKYTFIQNYLYAFNGRDINGAEIEEVLAEIPIFEAVSYF